MAGKYDVTVHFNLKPYKSCKFQDVVPRCYSQRQTMYSHTFTHHYSINNIVSGSHYTHKIDELIILQAVCSQIFQLFYLCEMMHSLDVIIVF